MTDPQGGVPASWLEQNQAYLSAEFARLRDRLSGTQEGSEPQPETEAHAEALRAAMTSPPAIDVLAQLFGFTGFERQLLLLCAGVDMDSRLAESCASAQGSPQKTYATFGLALALLPDSHWDAITPSRPLRRLRMLEVQRGSTLTSAPLRVDERLHRRLPLRR